MISANRIIIYVRPYMEHIRSVEAVTTRHRRRRTYDGNYCYYYIKSYVRSLGDCCSCYC